MMDLAFMVVVSIYYCGVPCFGPPTLSGFRPSSDQSTREGVLEGCINNEAGRDCGTE